MNYTYLQDCKNVISFIRKIMLLALIISGVLYFFYSKTDDPDMLESFIEREQEFVYKEDILEFPAVVNVKVMLTSYSEYRQETMIWMTDLREVNTMEEAEELYLKLTDGVSENTVLPEVKYRILMFACEDVMNCVSKDSESYYEIMYTFKDRYLNMYASIDTFSRVRYDAFDFAIDVLYYAASCLLGLFIFEVIIVSKIVRDKIEKDRRQS